MSRIENGNNKRKSRRRLIRYIASAQILAEQLDCGRDVIVNLKLAKAAATPVNDVSREKPFERL